jgi:uncharacterized damage-inducible protein DinB
MHTELSNLREHLDRYRAVTLQTIDVVPDDAALAWRARLDVMPASELDAGRDAPSAPPGVTMRWWLWFILEHEIHHKAQAAVYLRQMGFIAPFYAMPLPIGARPDFASRESLGGV